jgi:phosphatidylinositol-4,5-bisphosphate 3-kinase
MPSAAAVAPPAVINRHQLDILLPNESLFSIPVLDETKGAEIIALLEKYSVSDYVLCRTAQARPQFYDVLYADQPTPEIAALIALAEPFPTVLLSAVLLPSRGVVTQCQRMLLFVFATDHFLQLREIDRADLCAPKRFMRRSHRFALKVRLPTGLVVAVETKRDALVGAISSAVHREMEKLYPGVRPSARYQLGTIAGCFPDPALPFGDVPAFVSAMRKPPGDVHFCLRERCDPTVFDQKAALYTRELDLSEVPRTVESQCLNAAFSALRAQEQDDRLRVLAADPLRARMRISTCDPPLTTYMQRLESEAKAGSIAMKVELASTLGSTGSLTGLSVTVPYVATADQAIRQLLKKMQRVKHRSSGTFDTVDDSTALQERGSSDNYVLLLRGMNEVLAGPVPLEHFVCVRHFLLSSATILNLILSEKQAIIADIHAREMNDESLLPEPSPDEQASDIRVPVDCPPPLAFGEIPALVHSRVSRQLSVFVHGCFKIPMPLQVARYALTVSLIHGTALLCPSVSITPVSGGSGALFNETVTLPLSISALPRAARLAFTLSERSDSRKERPIGTYNFPVFQFNGWMSAGEFTRKMWLGHGLDFFLTTCESNEKDPIKLQFSLPPFYAPIGFVPIATPRVFPPTPGGMTEGAAARVAALAAADPLEVLSDDDRALLWKWRAQILNQSALLPFLLLSVNYADPAQVAEVPLILSSLDPPLKPTEALTLLDAKYADPEVRSYAVARLNGFRDDEIGLFLLQLVQALKYELYDDSPLARFLIRRGLREPKFLGHQLFWQLMSEAHLSHIRQRFSALLVNFFYGMGGYREELLQGYKFTQQLVALNRRLGHLEYSVATAPFREALRSIVIPEEFHLPMDPRLIVRGFIIEKCKVMNSKKKPFWLTFENASPFANEPVMTMFKVGDDLRQDQLTLQLMKVMESLWRTNGADFHMRCYGVLPTGFEQGFIEVVPRATTESDLQCQRGTLKGVLVADLFTNYLQAHCGDKALANARVIFRKSSAGYAVATSVLGIADRHPGNIMVQEDGHFFHIDFGHFLGNWKVKCKLKREDGSFHFSPACKHTIGGSDEMQLFTAEAKTGLEILRQNSKLLITLFLLMLGTGIPELKEPSDIDYIKKMLYLDKTTEAAGEEFELLIRNSIQSTVTKVNNFCHNWKVNT